MRNAKKSVIVIIVLMLMGLSVTSIASANSQTIEKTMKSYSNEEILHPKSTTDFYWWVLTYGMKLWVFGYMMDFDFKDTVAKTDAVGDTWRVEVHDFGKYKYTFNHTDTEIRVLFNIPFLPFSMALMLVFPELFMFAKIVVGNFASDGYGEDFLGTITKGQTFEGKSRPSINGCHYYEIRGRCCHTPPGEWHSDEDDGLKLFFQQLINLVKYKLDPNFIPWDSPFAEEE
jgi:hypothetical protein